MEAMDYVVHDICASARARHREAVAYVVVRALYHLAHAGAPFQLKRGAVRTI